MEDKKYHPLIQMFDVGEFDDHAVLPLREISGQKFIIISKKQFKVFETGSTYVLEVQEGNPDLLQGNE